MVKKLRLDLPNVMCASCQASIENTLLGITQFRIREREFWDKEKKIKLRKKCFRVDIARKTLVVEVEDNGMEAEKLYDIIINALEETGNVAERVSKQPAPSLWPHVLKAILGIGTGLTLLALSAFGVGIPLLAMYIITGASVALSLYLGKESYRTTYKKLRKSGTVEMNALFAVSSLVAIGVSIASLFVPWLPMMLDTALMIFGFRHLGIAIEEKAKRKITANLNFQQRTPKKVAVKTHDGKFEEREIATIQPGDIILIKPNQIIPLDGKCLNKQTRINTSIVDGAPKPRKMYAGNLLSAGMRLESVHSMTLQVTQTVKNSFLAQLDKNMEQAEMQKAPLETSAEKILKYFVPSVFLLAGIAAVVALFFLNPALAVQCATSLLVSACPCTLGSIVPLAITVGMNKAAKQGVQFKSGKAVQLAAETDTVIFDLHGTLTEGIYQVTDCTILPDYASEKAELLACLYELEKESEHAVGSAIKKYVATEISPAAESTRVIQQVPEPHHAGRTLMINGEYYRVGNATMMQAAGIDLSAFQQWIADHEREQIIFYARGDQIVGHVLLADPLKREARAVIKELQRAGKEVHLCTGADRATALYYAKRLKIPADRVLADCVPISKTTSGANSKSIYIQKLQDKHKKVAMIGDAENDIIPFKTSNLAILIKSPSTSTSLRQNADVIIQKTSLLSVLTTFSIAKKTVSNIRQNLGISLGYNVATLAVTSILIFALGFAINPGVGVALMIIQAGLVLLNVYRLKEQQDASLERVTARIADQTLSTNADLHNTMGLKSRVTFAPEPEPEQSSKGQWPQQDVQYPLRADDANILADDNINKQGISDPADTSPEHGRRQVI
jgi:Cu2+-exporting ATPase